MQSVLDAFIWDETQVWGLAKRHRQASPKCLIEIAIAGLIGEVCENNGVFIRKFWRAVRV